MDAVSLDPSGWIGSVGFPVAVASYLLIRVEGTISQLRDEVRSLSAAIASCPFKKPPASPA